MGKKVNNRGKGGGNIVGGDGYMKPPELCHLKRHTVAEVRAFRTLTKQH